MGNTPNQKTNKENNTNNSNIRLINSTDLMNSKNIQNMEYSNIANFDVNAKMKSTLKYLEKNNFVSLKFVRKI
jgi:hypothetical protein